MFIIKDTCTLKTTGKCDGYHGPRPCDFAASDGNPDDPTWAYCGYPTGHAGDHGHWII